MMAGVIGGQANNPALGSNARQQQIQQIQNAIQLLFAQVQQMVSQGVTSQTDLVAPFLKDLKSGDINPDVKRLQQYLNLNGFSLSETGPGSLNNETDVFGILTKNAVIRLQEYYTSEVLTPLGLEKGTGKFGPLTRQKVNSLLGF